MTGSSSAATPTIGSLDPAEHGDVLQIRNLAVAFATEHGVVQGITDLSYSVGRGEILAVVGESGSGKSVSTRAALRLLPSNATASGSIRFAGSDRDVSDFSAAELRALRGAKVSMIFQEPSAALDPVYRVGHQIVETLRLHRSISRKAAWARAIELLELVGIPEPATKIRSYPHQLSGGQKQRVIIAMAIALEPDLIIADEPTTALDVTVQAEILALLRSLRDRLGTSILLITHNMGVVADLADRVVVMRAGRLVETAPVGDVFERPQEEYTRSLLAAVPRISERDSDPAIEAVTERPVDEALVLSVDDLHIDYPGGFARPPVHAVRGVSFTIGRGRTLGLVGESGSGKSTIGQCIVGTVGAASGLIRIGGADAAGLRGRGAVAMRRRIGMVFQDPRASLNPTMTVAECIVEPLLIHKVADRQSRERKVTELLDAVSLPGGFAERYPHELSGGQRQRVSIARALVLDPSLVIADEPTSALDVSVQASVLELFQQLQRELGFACLFISHDLAVVDLLAQEVAVLRHGAIVEIGPTAQVLGDPRDPYTRALIDAVPVPDPLLQAERRLILPGTHPA